MAAGFTIQKNKIEKFKIFINKAFKKETSMITKKYVSKISLAAINNQFYNNIKRISPFGHNNLNPIFLINNLRIIKPRVLKNNFLSFFM